MKTIKEIPDQFFEDSKAVFQALKNNKEAIIASKKMQTKLTDAISFSPTVIVKGETIKAINPENLENIKVKVVINTTNLLDSHGDVHIDGIWNKSVKEQRNLYLIQEHQMTFTNIISDDVKATIDKTDFKTLGVDLDGGTEALVFETNIQKNRNSFMFEQYAKGFVKNHSVGMRYVSMDLAVNSDDEDFNQEKGIWDKYINKVSNKSEAEEKGYFWAITEAKIIEGSAVPVGSNWATPTLSTEAVNDTSKQEPSNDTQKNKLTFINLKK
jgi:hypothetical protein